MRGYEVRVAVDLDQVEEAAQRSGRDIDDLLNEFAQRLQETGERLVESWTADPPGRAWSKAGLPSTPGRRGLSCHPATRSSKYPIRAARPADPGHSREWRIWAT